MQLSSMWWRQTPPPTALLPRIPSYIVKASQSSVKMNKNLVMNLVMMMWEDAGSSWLKLKRYLSEVVIVTKCVGRGL